MALGASAPPVPGLSLASTRLPPPVTSALAGVGALGAALHVGGSLLIVAGQTIVKVSHCIRETSANPGGWLVRPLVVPAGAVGGGGGSRGDVEGGDEVVYPKWRRPDGAWRSHHVGYRMIAAFGWFLFAVGNALRFASMRFAAQTVLSGLGSLQFALIPPVSRLLLGVRSGASALVGVLLVLLGNVLILACGPGETDFTLPQLRALWLDGDMRLFLAATALVLAASHVAWRELKRPGKVTMRLLLSLDRTGWVGAGRKAGKVAGGGMGDGRVAAGGGRDGGVAGSDRGALDDERARLALASTSEEMPHAQPLTSSVPSSSPVRRSFPPAHRRSASLDGPRAGEGDRREGAGGAAPSLLSGKRAERREGDARATDKQLSRDPSAGASSAASAASSAASAATPRGGEPGASLRFSTDACSFPSTGDCPLALTGSSSLPLPGSGGRGVGRASPPSLRVPLPSADPLRLAASAGRLSRPSPAPLSPSACVSSPTAAPEADPAAVLVSAVLFSTVAASIGAWSVLFSKSLTFVVAAAPGSLRDPYSWFVAVAFVATASFWIARSDQGLRLYPALLIMPLMQATWTAASVLQGGVYFEEFQGIPPGRTGLLVLGLVVALGGALAMGVDGYRGERDAAVRDEDRRAAAPSIDDYVRVIDLEEGWSGGAGGAGGGPARRRPTLADPLEGLELSRRASPSPAPGSGGRDAALAAPGAAKSAAAKSLKAANGAVHSVASTAAANAALELAPLLQPDGSATPESPGGGRGGPSGLAAVRPLSGAPVRRGASHAGGHLRTSSL